MVTGLDLGNGASRFTLPYAQPPIGPLRFANPQPLSAVKPDYDMSKTPPMCYQSSYGIGGGTVPSEDCLYNTFYYPTGVSPEARLPIIVWIHGGSGVVGSSSEAGLDGSLLASTQQAIVVFVQYRLGLFGWLQTGDTLDEVSGGSPGSNKVAGNQAMRDVIMALRQIRDLALHIGGDPSRVLLMGHSSGATMVRALLTTPAAIPFFSRVVLVSDPANYGLSSVADNNVLGQYGMTKMGCTKNDITCARNMSADDILTATLQAYSDVPQLTPRISRGTPWRPMRGIYITGSIEKGIKPRVPVLMTTVQNEAGAIISSRFAQSTEGDTRLKLAQSSDQTMSMADGLNQLFNHGRGYILAGDEDQIYTTAEESDGLRSTFETIATDGMWRCAVQYNARVLTRSGSPVWLAQWNIGSTHPSNVAADYCTRDGHVCHEDDVQIIFGTAPQPSAAIRQLSAEWQTRLAAFARNGRPKFTGALQWDPVKSASNLNLLVLAENHDSSAAITTIQPFQRLQACEKLWGERVEFDWQLYET